MTPGSRAILLAILLVGSVVPTSASDPIQKVARIRPTPKITHEQASTIFNLYYSVHIHQRCLPTVTTSAGNYWVCYPPSDEDCNQDKEPMRIEMTTGRITWAKGPAYNSPQELAKAAKKLSSP
jgi:hypothetical protein